MTYNEDDKKVYQTDLIYKSDVLETYAELYDIFDDNKNIQKEFDKVFDKLNDIPAVEPKQGGWIRSHIGTIAEGLFCSNCKQRSYDKTNFCPNCGAYMKGTDNETD